jgi:hypothetical protein
MDINRGFAMAYDFMRVKRIFILHSTPPIPMLMHS